MHCSDPNQVVDIDDEHHNTEEEQADEREHSLDEVGLTRWLSEE